MSSSVTHSIGSKIGRAIGLPTDWSAQGWHVNADGLDAEQQAVFDDGEPLEVWLDWWMQAGEIRGDSTAARLVVLQPGWRGRRRAEPLTREALQRCFDCGAGAIDGGFFLAWGLPDQAQSTDWGAAKAVLSVAVDGCAAVLLCAPGQRSFFTEALTTR